MANAPAQNANRRPPPPALNPESGALTQPYKDFVSKGWITELNPKFTPLGYTCSCVLGDMVAGKPAGQVPMGVAKEAIIKSGLWSPKTKDSKNGKSKEQARPAKSLVKKDFEDGAAKIAERIVTVSGNLSDTTARGRIGSLKLYLEGADTFDKWWNVAPASSKVRLFTDQKHYKDLTPAEHELFVQAVPRCPFRGTVPTPSEEEEDQSEDEAAQTTPKASEGQ